MADEYGRELILDLHGCNVSLFNRKELKKFFESLCDDVLDMRRADLHFWDYEGHPKAKAEAPSHLKGTTAIQFIYTSNVTLHALDDLGAVYLNIFSCKEFDVEEAASFCARWFGATERHQAEIVRS